MMTIPKPPDTKTLADLAEILRIFWNQNSRFKVARCTIQASRPSYCECIEYFISMTSAWNTKAGLIVMVDDLKPLEEQVLTTRLYEEVIRKKVELEKMLIDKEG